MTRVSTVKRIITPLDDCFMGGYSMRTEKSKGILHDLNCSALALEIEEKTVVFCMVELLMVDSRIVNSIIKRVTKENNIDEDSIFIGATHTHAGPELRLSRLMMYDEEYEDGPFVELEKLEEFLIDQISQAISECLKGEFFEVDAKYQTVSINGVYGNRNSIEKPEDKDVSVIKFMDKENVTRASIVNISCHPTVLGAENLYISNDLLGYIAREIEDEFGVYPIIMQGAAGDISNRNHRKGHDEQEVIRSGSAIAKQMFANDDYLQLNLNDVGIDHYNYFSEYQLDIAELKSLKEKTEQQMNAESDYDKHKILLSAVTALEMKIKNPDIVCDFNAEIIRLGDIVICAHSGEMFSGFGKQIKSCSNEKLPMIWGYVNDYSGYMTTKDDYGSNYESMMSPFPIGASEQITEDLCDMIAGD